MKCAGRLFWLSGYTPHLIDYIALQHGVLRHIDPVFTGEDFYLAVAAPSDLGNRCLISASFVS